MKVNLNVLLTVTSDRLMCETLAEAGTFLTAFTGHKSDTLSFGRLADAAKPYLFRQLPFLASIDLSYVTPENAWDVLASLEQEHGKEFDVDPMPSGTIVPKTAIELLQEEGFEGSTIVANLDLDV